MKNFLLILALGVAVLVAVLVTRTWLHQPLGMIDIEVVQISLDEQAIATRLAESVRYRTVSHQSEADFQAAEFEGFIDWVAESYPEFHAALDLQRLGGYTLLYRWQGTDPSLQPILGAGRAGR